jgi:hypothetical protein
MTTPVTTDPTSDVDEAPRRRWTPGRVASLLALAAIIVFWGWALGPFAPRNDPDELEDKAYRELIIPRCTAMTKAIAGLPPAPQTPRFEDRLAVIEQGNAIVRELATFLRGTVGGSDHDRRLLDLWVTDWETYARDREDYAARLRVDRTVRFEVTARVGSQITTTIDTFASKNRLTDCRVPIDV